MANRKNESRLDVTIENVANTATIQGGRFLLQIERLRMGRAMARHAYFLRKWDREGISIPAIVLSLFEFCQI